MDWLDQELKHALRREEPSPDFAARVLRSAAGTARHRSRWPVLWRRWLAVAAALLVICGAGIGYRRHQGAVARQQVMFAVKFAGAKMIFIQTRVREVMR